MVVGDKCGGQIPRNNVPEQLRSDTDKRTVGDERGLR